MDGAAMLSARLAPDPEGVVTATTACSSAEATSAPVSRRLQELRMNTGAAGAGDAQHDHMLL